MVSGTLARRQVGPHEPRITPPVRYLLVGAFCALIQNLVLIGADAVQIHYTFAMVAAAIIVTPVAYGLHCFYTFEKRSTWDRFGRFAAGVAVGFPLSFALMAIFCSVLSWPVIVATPLTTMLLFVWNYLSARWAILLRHQRPPAFD